MTKYIDLLRSHQKKKPQSNSDEALTSSDNIIEEQTTVTTASATGEKISNPYSQDTRGTANKTEQTSSPELIEESEIEQPQVATQPSEIDMLIVEDDEAAAHTDEQPVSTEPESNEEPTTLAQPDSAQGFHIATWLQQLSANTHTIFQSAQQQKPCGFSQVNSDIATLLQEYELDKKTLDALELEISRNLKSICHSDNGMSDLIEKSIMMMLYTIKIGLQLNLQHQELVHHTVAAMVNHIGMAMVPDDVRLKVGKLTKDEIKLIKGASKNAVAYLKSCNLDQDNIILAASQSSERYDGSGATGLSGHNIAWIARVVGLLSIFEALIHFRPYRQRLLPRDAIRELVNNHKKEFDPVLLKALIEAVSLYPVGTFVQLNTGEIGQVITVHNKFPLRPVVYISMDKYGNTITEREINLKQQPNLMIQKCMYEESLGSLQENVAQ